MLAGAVLIFIGVMALVLLGLRGRSGRAGAIGSRVFIVGGGVVFPAVVLTALLVYTVMVGARLTAPAPRDALAIEITGHMWWWDVRYGTVGREPAIVSANELRIPAGRPVHLTLRSADVIHSFWVPNIAGKLDMIPGRSNATGDRAPTRRALTAASAPSSAGCSTPRWHCTWWWRRPRSGMPGSRVAGRRRNLLHPRTHPKHSSASSTRAGARCSSTRAAALPRAARRGRPAGGHRARPHPRRQPHIARRRPAAEQPRHARRLDRRQRSRSSRAARCRRSDAHRRQLTALAAYLGSRQ
jgi:hypothetical protein